MPAKSDESNSLAKNLERFEHLRKSEITVGEMIERVEGQDGPGPVLLILTLPVLLPLPPGFSMLLALPLLLVAPQIMIGRDEIWLPGFLRHRSIKRDDLKGVLKRFLPPLQKVEMVVKPRLRFLTGRVGAGLAGLGCTLLAIVLVLPIPFANLAPALAICAFALGLTRKDGLFILGGYALIAVAVVAIVWGAHGVHLGWEALKTVI